jgi:pimeloyl-ACP methyl ester carboxylesterase
MQQKSFLYNGTTVCYHTSGQGAAVVLLHGFGEDGNIWHNQVAALEANYRLIVPDIPGSGLSGTLAGHSSIEDFAAVIKAITEAENIDTCTMMGHSMGGYIALAYAEKYPNMLNGLGLVHSTAFADSDEKKIARAKSIDFIQANGTYPFFKTSIPGLFSSGFASDHASVIEALVANAGSFSEVAVTGYYTAMINRPDRTAILASFEKPVLFIAGIHDKAVPIAQSLKQCSLPSQAHIHILRHSGHMGMLEEISATSKAMADFLALCYQ